jgi:hypothetical protein
MTGLEHNDRAKTAIGQISLNFLPGLRTPRAALPLVSGAKLPDADGNQTPTELAARLLTPQRTARGSRGSSY